MLTDSGISKLERQDVASADLVAGVDCEVGAGDGETCFAYLDVASTTHFRHTWITVRRARAVVHCFGGCSLPRHGSREDIEKTASIAMAYFRPLTLCRESADDVVVYTTNWCPTSSSWGEACTPCLGGSVVSEDAARYVNNFRIRPKDPDEDVVHSGDDVSDEELQVSHIRLDDMLQTRVGGRSERRTDQTTRKLFYWNDFGFVVMGRCEKCS